MVGSGTHRRESVTTTGDASARVTRPANVTERADGLRTANAYAPVLREPIAKSVARFKKTRRTQPQLFDAPTVLTCRLHRLLIDKWRQPSSWALAQHSVSLLLIEAKHTSAAHALDGDDVIIR